MKLGAFQGAYPERVQPRSDWLERVAGRVSGRVLRWRRTLSPGRKQIVDAVESNGRWAAGLDEHRIIQEATELGMQLRREGFPDATVARCFSLVREVADRTLGKRHFDVQLIGGRLLLDGMVAEMETGEGKTLTATLAAATAALAGIPVHVITVNDYLASRDAEWMRPIYESLGLSVGTVLQGLDFSARREAYRADITYCTNKQVVFDYLKDRIVLGRDIDRAGLEAERLYAERPRMDQLILRGLCFAIVDEADSVLVDEARTPLIISGPSAADSSERETYETALSIAAQMERDREFIVADADRSIRLLPDGLDRLDAVADRLGGVWSRRQWREELLSQALTAKHLYVDGKHYLIEEGRIQIIDEYTGRVMPDRAWERGLHQMIEVKEGCSMTGRTDPLARISYQRFFRRYLWLAGMTGTAQEVAAELWSVYRLTTVQVPTNRPSRRRRGQDRIYPELAAKWNAVVQRIEEVHRSGRPVLVGTRSVEASERLSRLLTEHGLAHRLLNARQDRDEAMIVAEAGARGRITVATNMAGRGTDIQIEPEIEGLGGLHVIATELHEARRIDRQLFGRCGRQGDSGTCEAIVSFEDDLHRVYSRTFGRVVSRAVRRYPRLLPSRVRALSIRTAQRSAERLHGRVRRDLLKMDDQLDTTLAFSGRSE